MGNQPSDIETTLRALEGIAFEYFCRACDIDTLDEDTVLDYLHYFIVNHTVIEGETYFFDYDIIDFKGNWRCEETEVEVMVLNSAGERLSVRELEKLIRDLKDRRYYNWNSN